ASTSPYRTTSPSLRSSTCSSTWRWTCSTACSTRGSAVLESADTDVVAGSLSAAAAVEEPPEEVFEKRGIGVLAWLGIGWLAFVNIFLAFPQLVLALTLVAVLAPVKPSGGTTSGEWGHRIIVVILAVGIVSVPLLGRITRASAISWSQREFVMAARAQGATSR